MSDVVLTQLQNGVLTVTLNRPDDNNRMDRRDDGRDCGEHRAGGDR